MLMPEHALVVTQIAGERATVEVKNDESQQRAVLQQLGFTRSEAAYTRLVRDHMDRQALVRELIDADALFVGGPDWSPAEIVEYYRDQKAVSGPYKRIVWRSPERYEVSVA